MAKDHAAQRHSELLIVCSRMTQLGLQFLVCWGGQHGCEDSLCIIDISSIQSVVAMIPHSPPPGIIEERYFLVEKTVMLHRLLILGTRMSRTSCRIILACIYWLQIQVNDHPFLIQPCTFVSSLKKPIESLSWSSDRMDNISERTEWTKEVRHIFILTRGIFSEALEEATFCRMDSASNTMVRL